MTYGSFIKSPYKGHGKANATPKRFICEFNNVELSEYEVGQEITVDVFKAGRHR